MLSARWARRYLSPKMTLMEIDCAQACLDYIALEIAEGAFLWTSSDPSLLTLFRARFGIDPSAGTPPFNALYDFESLAWALVDLTWRRNPIGPPSSLAEQRQISMQASNAKMVFANRLLAINGKMLYGNVNAQFINPTMRKCQEQCGQIWAHLSTVYTQLEQLQDGMTLEVARQSVSAKMQECLQILVEHYTREPVQLVPYDKDVFTYEAQTTSNTPASADAARGTRAAPQDHRVVKLGQRTGTPVPAADMDDGANERLHALRPRKVKRTRESDSSDTDEPTPVPKKPKISAAAAPVAPVAPAAPVVAPVNAPIAVTPGFIGNGRIFHRRLSRRVTGRVVGHAYIGEKPPTHME